MTHSLTNHSGNAAEIGKAALWTGRILSGLVTFFMAFDAIMKLAKPAPVVESTVKLGYPENTLVGMGIVLLISTVLYAYKKTSILGAILITGYLGGAVASNVRAQAPAFNCVFAVIFGVFAWAGLWLRDQRLQALVPLRSEEN